MTAINIKNRICVIDNSDIDPHDQDVRDALEYVAGDSGPVDNMYKAMVHSPKVIRPIHDLYLALLHDRQSPLDKWVGELLAVQVAILNNCTYALAHHSANLSTYINNPDRYKHVIAALSNKNWRDVTDDSKITAMLEYSHKLCQHPDQVSEADIELLRGQGLSEREIVFIAQIIAGFAYWTRILNALGVELAGEPIGIAGSS